MLEVKQLTKVYKPKNGAEVRALNGVDLKFADKGLVFLLGKSGSGKSTLLNLIGGLDSYTSGDIIIKGKSSASFKQSDFDSYRNTYIGFIFQEFNILEDYSVGKNIGLALELQHKKADETAINEILAKVDLDGYADRKPNELSGGQKQRVAIARALVKNPEIIMGDEPTGSLDSKTGKQVFDTLKKLSKDKLVVVVSHDRENAELYGDRVIELADGVVISDRIRSEETGVLESQPISFVTDKLVRIESGYQLDADDVKKINALLLNSKTDVFISADEFMSGQIKKAANITEKTNTRAGFVNTTEQNYSVKTYQPKDFRLVKSKLPFKDSLKMGASGLKLKKVRLVFTILLSFFAFFLFGFSNTAAAIDNQQSQMRTFSSQGGRGVLIQSESGRKYSFGGTSWYDWDAPGISQQQVDDLKQLSGKPLLKLVQRVDQYSKYVEYFRLSLSSNIDKISQIISPYYLTNVNYVVETPSLIAAGLTPADNAPNSKMPETFDEIAITDYIADVFIDYGYKKMTYNEMTGITTTEVIHVENYGDLIGKTIFSNGSYYTISGVFNTGFNMADFADYKTTTDAMSMMTASGFSDMTFGMAYVKEGFGAKWQETGYAGLIGEMYPTIKIDPINEYIVDPLERQTYFLAKLEAYKNYVVWVGDNDESSFDKNSIIVTSWSLGVYGDENGLEKADVDRFFTEEYEPNGVLTMNGVEPMNVKIVGVIDVDGFIGGDLTHDVFIVNDELFNDIKEIKSGDAQLVMNDYGLGNFSSPLLYNSYINSIYRYSAYTNRFNVHFKNGFSLTDGKLQENQIIIPFNMFIDSTSNQQNMTFEQAKTLFGSLSSSDYTCDLGRYEWDNNGITISSVIKGGLEIVGMTESWGEVIVSNEIYDYFASQRSDLKKAVVVLSGDFSKDRAVFDYIFGSEVMDGNFGTRIKPFTTLTPIMDMLGSLIPTLRTVFFYISLAFSVFAALLLMNFLGVSINHKKKDIGVLRAIGARSKDVFMIFFNESMIIGVINFVLSVAAVVTVCIILNVVMGVVLFVPGIIQIALMFALCFGIALISTYLPVRKIARKKPIDAINNR